MSLWLNTIGFWKTSLKSQFQMQYWPQLRLQFRSQLRPQLRPQFLPKFEPYSFGIAFGWSLKLVFQSITIWYRELLCYSDHFGYTWYLYALEARKVSSHLSLGCYLSTFVGFKRNSSNIWSNSFEKCFFLKIDFRFGNDILYINVQDLSLLLVATWNLFSLYGH